MLTLRELNAYYLSKPVELTPYTCPTVNVQAALGQGRCTGAIAGHSRRKESLLRQTPFQFCSGFAPIYYWARQKAEITYLDVWCDVLANPLPILVVSRRGNQQPPASALQTSGVWK